MGKPWGSHGEAISAGVILLRGAAGGSEYVAAPNSNSVALLHQSTHYLYETIPHRPSPVKTCRTRPGANRARASHP